MNNNPFPIIQKPKFGEPCNRCGECCRVSPCHVSIAFLKSVIAPCVALEVEANGEFSCGMVKRPHYYMPELARSTPAPPELFDFLVGNIVAGALAIGHGCGCMDDYLERHRKLFECHGEEGTNIGFDALFDRIIR